MPEAVDMDFLRQEYFALQATVESFDEKALTIKAWSVTLSMAAIGGAFIEAEPALLLLAAGASLLFWIIEASWKTFQQANYRRLRIIEDYMRGKPQERPFSSPDITDSWSAGWREESLWRVLFWHHVFLPHAVVVVAGISFWLANEMLGFIAT